MPRVLNTRPTAIYWLLDVRPATLTTWPNGRPFYCGKTILSPAARFTTHRSDARKYPHKAISQRLNECCEHVRIKIMEMVPPGVDWVAREKFWIYTLRTLYPGAVNITSGGQGSAGYVASAETRAKLSAALLGKKRSAETRARIGAASRNRSPEVYAKIGSSQKGRVASAETRAKLSVAGLGKRRSAETRARMRAAAKMRPPERYAKLSVKLKGRVFSAETRARMSAAQYRRQQRERESRDARAV